MFDFIVLISNFFSNIIDVLKTAVFNLGGVTVSLVDIIIGFVVLSIIITVFWKGARG